MNYHNDTSGPPTVDSLLAMLQTLRDAPGGNALLAQVEGGQRVQAALVALVERAFIAFVSNVVDRYTRTGTTDPTARLKLTTIDERLDALIESKAIRKPGPEIRDAAALEQHLIALLWALRQPAVRAPATGMDASEAAKLKPLQRTLTSELDKAIYRNLDSIASLGSIEQTLRNVAPAELKDWREILRDATREMIDDYRELAQHLQQARTCVDEMAKHVAAPTRTIASNGALELDREILLQRLDAEMRRAQRYHHPLSLALLGPDRIEDIRQLIGTTAASEVLRYYLQNVTSCARAYDTVANYKPHKVIWVLPGANTDQGVRALRKARERITTAQYHYAGRSRPLPTFSAGVVSYTPGEDSTHFLARAESLAAHANRAGPSHIEWEKRRAPTLRS